MSQQIIGGECYVHGIADGQSIELAEREGREPQYFCIG